MCIAVDDLEDAERRAGRAFGIVLVGGRNAEVRADPVALVRLYGPAVLVDRAAHHRHALAHEDLGLVGLEALAECRRADDVGEEHGHGAALVLHVSRLRGGVGWSFRDRRRAHRRGGREPHDRAERLVLAQDGLLESA